MPMHCDNFPGEFRLVAAAAAFQTDFRHPQDNKQDGGGSG